MAEDSVPEIDVGLRPWVRRIVIGCLVAEGLFFLLDFAINYSRKAPGGIRKIFNVAREESLPTWFSSTQALVVGIVVLCIFLVQRQRGQSRLRLLCWAGLALLFIFIAMDDAAVIHERVGSALGTEFRNNLAEKPPGIRHLLDLPTYSWQIFIAPLYAAAGVFMLLFLWKHVSPFGLGKFLLLGLALLAFAVSIDWVEGIDGLEEEVARDWGVRPYTVSHYSRVIEETIEMMGITTLLYVFLSYLAAISDGLRLRLHRDPHPAAGGDSPPSESSDG